MKLQLLPAVVLGLVAAGVSQAQQVPEGLNEHLAVFEPFVGKTWRGEFAGSTAERPMIDVSRWERAINGQAVRILHSLNDGQYGGETIMMWDPNQDKIAFWYFTTAGFFTQGTIEIDGDSWSSIEEVTGNAEGITQVKSTARLVENGVLHVKSEYFADGNWTPGHDIRYRESPESRVIFR